MSVNRSNGYHNLAFDLLALAQVLRDGFSRIVGKTALQPSELNDAETTADRLLTMAATRERAPQALRDATDVRRRAFALFVATYHHARRAVIYLRWDEKDSDVFAPSLYAGRARTRRRAEHSADDSTLELGSDANANQAEGVAPAAIAARESPAEGANDRELDPHSTVSDARDPVWRPWTN